MILRHWYMYPHLVNSNLNNRLRNKYMMVGSILLLSGYKQSGKNVMADYLAEKYGYKQFAYADLLKDQVADRYGFPRQYCDHPIKKEEPLLDYPVHTDQPLIKMTFDQMIHHYRLVGGHIFHTPRSLLILEGTYMARAIHPSIWINSLMQHIQKYDRVCISDIRFPNEIEIPKKMYNSALSVRINRFHESNATDVTERSLDSHDFDYTIDNYGSLEDFYKKIDVFMSNLVV